MARQTNVMPTTDLDSQVGFLTRRFREAINANDQQALAAVFEPDAVLVVEPGKATAFSEQSDGPGEPMSLDAELGGLLVADNLAVLLVEWTITQKDGRGVTTRSTGRSTDIARRDATGCWRCIIDNGSGGGPANATRSQPGSDGHLDSLTGNLTAKLRQAVSRRDSQGLASCFEPDAVVVTEAGTSRASQELDVAFEKFTLANHFESAIRHTYVAGDVALIIEDWSLNTQGSVVGPPASEEGTATHVVRRGSDGSWRYVIYNSPGTAPYRDSTQIISG